MAHHCSVLLCTCKLNKSSCKCQMCLLPSQRDSDRSEKRWSEGMFVHCAQSHRASEIGMFLFLSAEISLERGHLKQRQKSSKSELCTALDKSFETEEGKKKSTGKDFSFLSCSLISLCFSFILILSLFAISVFVIMPTEVGFGQKPFTAPASCQTISICDQSLPAYQGMVTAPCL